MTETSTGKNKSNIFGVHYSAIQTTSKTNPDTGKNREAEILKLLSDRFMSKRRPSLNSILFVELEAINLGKRLLSKPTNQDNRKPIYKK